MKDDVFEGNDGMWYFYDKDDMVQGPFEEEDLAFDAYVRYLQNQ